MNADRSTRPFPWWYCLFIIVAVLPVCILSSEFVQAQTGQARSLRDISKVSVGVDVGGDDLPNGISESRLKTIIELKLRTAGLRVLSLEESVADPDNNPWVVLTLRTIPARVDGQLLGYSFSTDLTVLVFRYQAPGDAPMPVQLWQNAGLNISPTERTASRIESAVAELLDEFLNDWLAANPRR